MIATCALNWMKSLYNASEFSAAVSAVSPINLVLHLIRNTVYLESKDDLPVPSFIVWCITAAERSERTQSG